MESANVMAKGLCERIGIDGSRHTYKAEGQDDYVEEKPMPTHNEAVDLVLSAFSHQC